MKRLIEFPSEARRQIRFVLTDVDDTLTDGPPLPAATDTAIERLQGAGITVIPVTAAPAGWCDLMARMWPVGAVIGDERAAPALSRSPTHCSAAAIDRRSLRRLTRAEPQITPCDGEIVDRT
jgi:hypothetical protein